MFSSRLGIQENEILPRHPWFNRDESMRRIWRADSMQTWSRLRTLWDSSQRMSDAWDRPSLHWKKMYRRGLVVKTMD